jgi:hypothetical protein
MLPLQQWVISVQPLSLLPVGGDAMRGWGRSGHYSTEFVGETGAVDMQAAVGVDSRVRNDT